MPSSFDDARLRCAKFRYRSDYFDSTLVSEFDLVCDRAYLATLFKSSRDLGWLVGVPLFGIVADTFGRRPVMMLSAPLVSVRNRPRVTASEKYL